MVKKLLALIIAIGAFCTIALSQARYSESVPFKPRPAEKTDVKKKSKKNKLDVKSEPVATPTPVTTNTDEVVRIPIAVLDKSGVTVGGLTKSDVTVFVDDVEVPIATFEANSEPLSLILMLDTSPSTHRRVEAMQRSAAK